MRRIGIDGNSLTRKLTGVGMYLYYVLKYLLEIDKDTVYYIFSHSDLCVDFPETDNLKIINSRSMNVVAWYLFDLPKEVKKADLDIFWEPGNRLPSLPPANVKMVTTVHDMACFLYPKYCSWKTAIMEKLYLKKTCVKANKIISISNATKKDIINTFHIEDEKIKVIYNGDSLFSKDDIFNQNEWDTIKKKYGLGDIYFLFVGSISPRKNVLTIVKAYENYRENGGDGQLILAGKMAWKSKDIQRKIDNSNYLKDIIITGYIDENEKEYLYRNAECLLFPSLYEGFGLPILEAMSVGTRVITSNISSMPEVAQNAALYLNKLDDYEELSTLMKQMRDMSEEKRKDMIECGYLRRNCFNRRDTAVKTLELFDSLVKN